MAGTKVCETETMTVLFPDDCEAVSCLWSDPPADASAAVTVDVIADDGNAVNECKEGNNKGGIFEVFCKPAG